MVLDCILYVLALAARIVLWMLLERLSVSNKFPAYSHICDMQQNLSKNFKSTRDYGIEDDGHVILALTHSRYILPFNKICSFREDSSLFSCILLLLGTHGLQQDPGGLSRELIAKLSQRNQEWKRRHLNHKKPPSANSLLDLQELTC